MKNTIQTILLILLTQASIGLNAQDFKTIIQQQLDTETPINLAPYEWKIMAKKPIAEKEKNTIYIKQEFNGIPIHKAISTFVIKNKKIVYSTTRFIPIVKNKNFEKTPKLNAVAAVKKSAAQLNLSSTGDISIIEQKETNHFLLSGGKLSSNNIPVELIYVNTPDNQLKLAWNFNLKLPSGKHWFNINVDAASGNILNINDWVLNCNFDYPSADDSSVSQFLPSNNATLNSSVFTDETYKVYPLPYENPSEGDREVVVNPSDPLASPYGWHDTNGVSGAEYTITRGNNVWAFENISGEDEPGYSPDGGEALNFVFPLNFEQQPDGYLDASLTNLFYINNKIHDITYHYDFDEKAGNFQANNYGRGDVDKDGLPIGEDDFVYAYAQDGNGLNNASFGTPPDGYNPVMRMFLWSGVGDPGESLTITSPEGLEGSYVAIPAAFGPNLPKEPLPGKLVLVEDDDLTTSAADPTDACDDLVNADAINGNIAVIRRGECNFTEKILRVQEAGAIAAIMVNNVKGEAIIMAGEEPAITIPSAMVTLTLGESIIAQLTEGIEVTVSLTDAGPYYIDGDMDNGVVVHEYGHGISNRLTGGPLDVDCLESCTERDKNGDCVSGTYTEQMGEGWSDFLALIATMKTDDWAAKPRTVATFAIGEDLNGSGIRPYPYSTDTSINPATYDSTNDLNLPAPHGVGFVWATMLWDMTWALIDRYGYDPDIYSGTGGNNMALRLVMEGMKLQSCQPGFIDGRDAILAADELIYAGANNCLIYKAFAARGLGYSADQGESTSRFDQKEAFDLPPEYTTDCALGIENSSINSGFNLYPNPASKTVSLRFNTPFTEGKVEVYDLNGRKLKTLQANNAYTTEMDISFLPSGIYLVKANQNNSVTTKKLIIE